MGAGGEEGEVSRGGRGLGLSEGGIYRKAHRMGDRGVWGWGW